MITILGTYADQEAYEKHIASAHFQTHKRRTLHTMKALALSRQSPPNTDNKLTNYIQ